MRTVAIVAAITAAICLLLAVGRTGAAAYLAAKEATDADADLPATAVAIVTSANVTDLATIALPAIIAATALAASYRFGLFRESEPHLNITQEIHCQPLGESYRLVAVKATLHNNSKVLVRPHRAVCLLQQTSPMDDETVIAMYLERIEDNPTDAYDHAWWNLGEVVKTWPQRDLAIEPEERHPETFEFIIARAASGIRIAIAVYKDETDFAWMAYDYLSFDALTTGGTPHDEQGQAGE